MAELLEDLVDALTPASMGSTPLDEAQVDVPEANATPEANVPEEVIAGANPPEEVKKAK